MPKKDRAVIAHTLAVIRKFAALTVVSRYRKRAALGYVTAVVGAFLFVSLVASGTLVSSRTVSSTGVVGTISLGVYSDSACTQSLASIDWGVVSPGSSVTRVVYVKNHGSTQVTLSLSTVNWIPADSKGPISVSWNQEGARLASDGVVTAILSLSVSPRANLSAFGMDVVITGTG